MGQRHSTPKHTEPKPRENETTPWLDAASVFTENVAELGRKIFSTNRRYNILFVGIKGNGKSSFVNSLVTATSNGIDVRHRAESRRNDVTITKKMERYKIGNSIWIHDMPGLEESWMAPKDDTITKILDGNLPTDYDFQKSRVDSCWPSIFGSANYRAMDGVVIVVAAPNVSALAEDTTSMPMEFFNRLLTKCEERGIRYGVVVTKIDEECPQTAKDIKKVYTSKAIEGVVQVVNDYLGIGYRRILPIKNYTDEMRRDPNMDRLILHSLGYIVKMMNETADAKDEVKSSYYAK